MKRKLLLLLIIGGSLKTIAQPLIANYSFEDWTSRYGKTAPTGWKCDSISIANNSIKRANGGTHGSYALQLNTVTYETNVVSAIVQRDDSVTAAPGDLLFDYKVVNNNSKFNGLYIEIYFKDSKKKDLKDFNWSSTGVNSNFVAGTLPIKFNAGEVPKYYTLRISYYYADTVAAGEYTIVDNLRFMKGSGGISDVNTSAITVYPNPANDILNFTELPNEMVNKVRMISADGKISEYTVANSSIDVSGLTRGIYFIELYTSNGFVRREKVSIIR